MTNNNNNLAELPKTYTVAYYNPETDENLTQEEWNKLNSLNCSEEIIIRKNRIYISEKAYNKGIAMYGPGFWDEPLGQVIKFGGKVAVSTFAAGSIIATGGATAPLLLGTGASTWGLGKMTKMIAEAEEIEWLKDVADVVSDTGFGVATGALIGPSGQGFKSLATHIGEGASFSAKLVKEFHDMYNTWEKVKDIKAADFHLRHRSVGIDYHRWCGVCN